MARKIKERKLKNPAITIIGEGAGKFMRSVFSWQGAVGRKEIHRLLNLGDRQTSLNATFEVLLN